MTSRIIFIFTGVYMIPFFLGSVTFETGQSSIYPFFVPIVGAIAIILYLVKIDKEVWIKVIPYIFIFVGLMATQGTFVSYTFLGLAIFILFLNSIRPWND